MQGAPPASTRGFNLKGIREGLPLFSSTSEYLNTNAPENYGCLVCTEGGGWVEEHLLGKSSPLHWPCRQLLDALLDLKEDGQSTFSVRAPPLHWPCRQPIMKVACYGCCRLYSIPVPLFSNPNPNCSETSKLVYCR